MPYDTIVWGETTQNNGFAGVAAATGQDAFEASGDTLKMPADVAIVGGGGSSVTKPNGCRFKSDLEKALYHHLPANLSPSRMLSGQLLDIDIRQPQRAKITAELSNTNVNEASMVYLHLVRADKDGAPHAWPKTIREAMERAGGGRLIITQFSVVCGTAVTFKDGEKAFDADSAPSITAAEYAKFINPKKKYKILGLVASLGVASTGVIFFSKLSGEWAQRQPGVVHSKLLGTFEQEGAFSPCYEPIEFDGDKPPSMHVFALAAATLTGGLVLVEQ
jgi:hypothetical protein